MTETTNLNPPTLLLHLVRTTDVRMSLEGDEHLVEQASLILEGDDSKRAVAMLEGRSHEVIRLLKSRATWLEDIGLRETQP